MREQSTAYNITMKLFTILLIASLSWQAVSAASNINTTGWIDANSLYIDGAERISSSGVGTFASGTTIGGGAIGNLSSSTTSTDNAVMRWDGTTGFTAQNSIVTIDDAGNLAGVGNITTTTSVFIGNGGAVSAENSTAIGRDATATSNNAVAIGSDANASGTFGQAIGARAFANNTAATATGAVSSATGLFSTSVGYGSAVSSTGGIALGVVAVTTGTYGTAIGYQANASGLATTAIGYQAQSANTYAQAFGYQANASGVGSTAIGYRANATGLDAQAMGYEAIAAATTAVALGYQVNATGFGAYGIGRQAQALDDYAFAIGDAAYSSHDSSIALGREATTTAANQLMIGSGSYPLNTILRGSLTVNSSAATGSLIIGNNSASHLFVNGATGNVGIGTTSPDGILDVEGDDKIVYFQPTDITDEGGVKNSTKLVLRQKYDATPGIGIGIYNHNAQLQSVLIGSTRGLLITIDGTNQAFLTDTGHLGIGTTNPTRALYVNGTSDQVAIFDRVGAGSSYITFMLNGTMKASIGYDNSIPGLSYWNSSGSQVFVIKEPGNVGIGTTAPTDPGGAFMPVLYLNGTQTGFGPSIVLSNPNRTKIYKMDTFAGVLEFVDASVGSVMAINGSNVGIGTTNPSVTLHVSKDDATTNANTNVFYLDHTTTGTPADNLAAGMVFRAESNGAGVTMVETASIRGILATRGDSGFNDGALAFLTNDNDGGLTERVRIASDGKVGINTTAPTQALDIHGSINVSGIIYLNQTNGGYIYGQGQSTSNSKAYIRLTNSSASRALFSAPSRAAIWINANNTWTGSNGVADFSILNGTSISSLFTVEPSGNVGIGTTAPTQKLTVNGDVNISLGTSSTPTSNGCLILPGGGKVCGNTTCTVIYSPDGNTKVEACN